MPELVSWGKYKSERFSFFFSFLHNIFCQDIRSLFSPVGVWLFLYPVSKYACKKRASMLN